MSCHQLNGRRMRLLGSVRVFSNGSVSIEPAVDRERRRLPLHYRKHGLHGHRPIISVKTHLPLSRAPHVPYRARASLCVYGTATREGSGGGRRRRRRREVGLVGQTTSSGHQFDGRLVGRWTCLYVRACVRAWSSPVSTFYLNPRLNISLFLIRGVFW